ncbi:hypothetical protein R3P38DRAFT_2757561 [Favolaschia claudopus]|uniref:Uncharacterized protein n=1 Tax=Favolaschia claudopus TaxID=2862362 RepID=A0AAW0EI13_9AGAR
MQGRPTVGEVVAAVRAFEVGRDLQGKDENVKSKERTSYGRPTAARCNDTTHAGAFDFVIKLPSCSPTASVSSDRGEDEIVLPSASEDSDVVAVEGKNGKAKEDGVVAEKKKRKARRGTRGGAGRKREKAIVIPHDSDTDA